MCPEKIIYYSAASKLDENVKDSIKPSSPSSARSVKMSLPNFEIVMEATQPHSYLFHAFPTRFGDQDQTFKKTNFVKQELLRIYPFMSSPTRTYCGRSNSFPGSRAKQLDI